MPKTLTLSDVLTQDEVAVSIAKQFQSWHNSMSSKIASWDEVRRYKYAVDTTTTTNNQLPWKNKTTYPKLTQIADNLHANYLKSLFPKRKWLIWEGADRSSSTSTKKKFIEEFMWSVIERSGFKDTIGELLDDWITYGNAFAMPEWVDDRIQLDDEGVMKAGYVGPKVRRVSPLDIRFNPIASSFMDSPKIIRRFITLGDLKNELSAVSKAEEEVEKLWQYLIDIRNPEGTAFSADTSDHDSYLSVDGFTSFKEYLGSDYVEVLTFYGDLFIRETGEFHKNVVATIVDRHRLISIEPNPSWFGKAPIYHCSWRTRQDNLWGMGPLDNLVGMQYRIDHLENLKADVFDLNAFPPLKIKGFVEDFEWGPMERIHVSEEGDVEMIAPNYQILNANIEINQLEMKMEQIAGAPKEAMGIRTPGEKTAYEVERLESAAGRIFQAKIELFESKVVEPLLQGMLELARRKMVSEEIPVMDEDIGARVFQMLTPKDITGNGRLRPVAAKHFAERAERVQNLTAFSNSALGQDPDVLIHISGLGLAQMFEDLLDVQGYKLVQPYIRISERAEAQQGINAAEEQTLMQLQTPSGLTPDDVQGAGNAGQA